MAISYKELRDCFVKYWEVSLGCAEVKRDLTLRMLDIIAEGSREEMPDPIPADTNPFSEPTDVKPEPAAPATTYTKLDVREAFTAAQSRCGFSPKDFLNEHGYAKLSDVPETEYATLIEAANNAK